MKNNDPVWLGTLDREKGEFTADNPVTMRNWFRTQPSGVYQFVISPFKNKRSKGQNNYYWGVVMKELADAIGTDTDQVHEAMRDMFLKDTIQLGALTIPTTRSTTKLAVPEMAEYIQKIIDWAAATPEVAIVISPSKNEDDKKV